MTDLNALSQAARCCHARRNCWLGKDRWLARTDPVHGVTAKAPRPQAQMSLRLRDSEDPSRHDQRRLPDQWLRAVHPALGKGMKLFIRRKVEAWLILMAAWILIGRNVHRAPVTSRRDNNDMWAMAEKLEAIAKRISKNYP